MLATDWADDAVALLRANAKRNSIRLRVKRVRWDEPEPLLREAPWELVLGADLLYEERNAEQLLEPPAAARRRDRASPIPAARSRRRSSSSWDVEPLADGVYRLRVP